ncbi:uncharacterized protein LOC136086419 [Hydra vulgaris]|uniref:Uncharacterized protein LOC136086419 n=1 Tax=Hydra vulgaris TaxID=6087 RepID=A0ABM4CSB4_HYDVU
MSAKLSNIGWASLLANKNINDAHDMFVSIYNKLCVESIPIIRRHLTQKSTSPCKNVLRELKMGKKVNHNLTRDQRKAFKEIHQDKKIETYPFDERIGFVRIEHDKAIEKIREQIGPTKIISIDPTLSYAIKINSFLSNLNKKQRFFKDEYESIYPSDPVPPRLYGLIKAHKQDKFFPMRVVVSTIGTPCYGISYYMVSFDIVNLYPSIPLKEAILVLLDQLNKSVSYKISTKLTLTETKQLIEFCLFRCYFLWNSEINELDNSGPIGLSFMVVLAESFLQYHKEKAIKMPMTMTPSIDIKSLYRYILNFLDITVINNTHGKYKFKVYRKDAMTNLQIKPHSNHDPKILNGISNGYIQRAYTICSENHFKDEINFLIQVFTENGYDEKMLKGKLNQSSLALHKVNCDENIEWDRAETLEDKKFKRKVREALKIQKHQCSPMYGDNYLDNGQNKCQNNFLDFIF